MLYEVLRSIEKTKGPIILNDLSRELGIDASALEGMIHFWVRKGRIEHEGNDNQQEGVKCSSPSCGFASCVGMNACPFVAKMPTRYSICYPTVLRNGD